MKSIVYILIAVFMSSIAASVIPKTSSTKKQIVKIQCLDECPDSQLLYESATIIKSRLEEYAPQSFETAVDANQKTIEISGIEKEDVNDLLPMLTSQGKIEFYETYNRTEVALPRASDDSLFSLLNIPLQSSEIDNSSAILGSCKEENKSAVDAYLAQHYVSKPGKGIKFLWSESANTDGNYYLYLLKHDAAIGKSAVMKSGVKNLELWIEFNESGKALWSNLTKSNIGKSIAIVLDEKVYLAPKVMEEISDGKCLLSGDFSSQEINYLKSLINNDELPLTFTLKK